MGGFLRKGENQAGLVDSSKSVYTTYTWDLQNILGRIPQSSTGFGVTNTTLLYLKDATTPTFTAATESYISASLEYKYAKSVTWDDIKLTWYDTGMIGVIRQWRESVWSADRGLEPSNNYKSDTVLRCFLPEEDGYFGWKLKGSWPSSIRSGDLTYTSSDAKIVEVTLSYDWAEEFEGKTP